MLSRHKPCLYTELGIGYLFVCLFMVCLASEECQLQDSQIQESEVGMGEAALTLAPGITEAG